MTARSVTSSLLRFPEAQHDDRTGDARTPPSRVDGERLHRAPAGGRLDRPGSRPLTLTYKLSDQDAANRGAPTITLKTSTTLPGTQAQLAGASTIAIPRNGDANVTVNVPVPPGTPVGDYDVVLSAISNSVPAGADIVKTAKAKLTVVDQSAPSIRVSSPGDATYHGRAERRGRLRLHR